MEISRLFNSHKIKYTDLANYFNFDPKENKIVYFIIDLNYLMGKFLYHIGYEKNSKLNKELSNLFMIEFLNLICHYKSFFYNKCDIMSFFYITVNTKTYKNDPQINKMIKTFMKLITMIPRIYTLFYENNEQILYLKYNLIKKIKILKADSNQRLIFIDLCKNDNYEVYYQLSKDYYIFRFDGYKNIIYGFREFQYDYLEGIDPEYINPILSLITIYQVLEEIKISNSVRINDVILKYIKEHPKDDFNSIETKLVVLKLFSGLKGLESRLKKIERNLYNPCYKVMIETIMEHWRKTIHDNSILKINEILKVPQDKRIKIELLMNS